MKTKILICVVSFVFLVFSDAVYGQELCQDYFYKYRACVERQDAGRNLDYSECLGYDETSCEPNGCYWYETKQRCLIDICLADMDLNKKVTGADLGYLIREYGRIGCPQPVVPAPAPVPETGQTTSYATGDDGDLEMGVTWPVPRFTDNGDGTVTDNLTGLIWLKNANCFGTRTWNNALSDCNGLADPACGLTDASYAGDWRLPNYKELFSLIDAENYNPALPTGHPFTGVQSTYYWSSTTNASSTDGAWSVYMYYGYVSYYYKSSFYYVWPVRGGQ